MPSRSYEQLCALARALELVGDRWTILIVRHLTHGPRRFGDLDELLPGISPTLLTDRLRRMVDDGLVVATDDGGYSLTEFGRGVEPAMWELMRWGAVLLAAPDRMHETAQADWVIFPLRWLLSRHPVSRTLVMRIDAPPRAPVLVRLEPEDAHLVEPIADASTPIAPDAVLSATSVWDLAQLLSGRSDTSGAFESGDVAISGDDGWFATALEVAHGTRSTAVLAGRGSPPGTD